MKKRIENAKAGRGRFTNRKTLAVALAAAALGGAVGYHWFVSPTGDPTSLSAAKERAPYRFAWPRGTTYTYSLDWNAVQSNRFVTQQSGGKTTRSEIGGKLSLRGKLVLHSYGNIGASTVLGLSLRQLDGLSWQVLGQDVVQKLGKDALETHETFVEVDERGHILRSYFANEAPAELRGLVQWLLPHLQVSLPTNAPEWQLGTWQTEEETSVGRAEAAYEIHSDQPLVLSRKRGPYSRLRVADVTGVKQAGDDASELTCAPEGHLKHVKSAVKFGLVDASGPVLALEDALTLTLESLSMGPPRALPELRGQAFHGYALAETPSADLSAQQALLNRVGDMNVGDMVSNVLDFANAGHVDNRWLWRATGLLELHPEAAFELAAVFGEDELSPTGRAMILDLLASAGTKEAQEAMRKLLDSKEAKEDPTTRALFYNRVGLVEADSETAEFAKQQYHEQKGEALGPMRVATTYALGAVAGQRAAQGDAAMARELNQELVAGLAQAKAPDEQAVVIRAMGNAGLEENVGTLVDHTRSDSVEVRRAAADALRKTHTNEAVEALLGLLRDPSWEVQAAALSSLSKYSLSVDEVSRIEQLVVAGVVGSRNDPLLVTVLGQNATPEHPWAAGFAQLLQRNVRNGQLAARIRSITRRNGVAL